MRDPRFVTFAKNILNYSVRLQPGEKLLIDLIGLKDHEVAKCFIEEAYAIGAQPFVHIQDPSLNRSLYMKAGEEQYKKQAEFDLYRMKQMDAYVAVRSGDNVSELSDVPEKQMQAFLSFAQRPVYDERINNTKWCVMRYPSPNMAQMAGMSTEAFEDFYFKVCNLDYGKMSEAMDPLVDLMQRTDQVRITAPGTDLTFSIKGIPAIKCAGANNIPDGEVFTAPVKNSVNGTITYNTPTVYEGSNFENVKLRFENGKIVEATSSDTKRLNDILDTDEGARFIGEFAIGVNPFIQKPMRDILFDEKIDGSFHFTPGKAYEDADNGNRSSVHWDMVQIQRPDYGGGEIYFDGVLIRKDGRFVIPELQALNPENLK
ncbi:aminopeptidase [Paenibacillus turpanensis]|uniref:aminopeptidase n=1 Tax=Paenibacillus turpanensis TaxID=2689078 RepID=UPI00140B7051|nr:aminopeptidase [Paenibacillus turpanensis]